MTSSMIGEPIAEPPDVALDLVPLLHSISKTVRAWNRIELAEIGLARGQDVFFLQFALGDLLPFTQLVEGMGIRPSTLSKMLVRLEGKGLARREGDTRDLRRLEIQLTPPGFKVRTEVFRVHAEMERELLRMLDGEAVAEANVPKLAAMLTRLLKQSRP